MNKTLYAMYLIFCSEAAKECRRRKKEYVRCLETRVAVLENQNKQLIDELQALKEMYVHKHVGTISPQEHHNLLMKSTDQQQHRLEHILDNNSSGHAAPVAEPVQLTSLENTQQQSTHQQPPQQQQHQNLQQASGL